jgi:hypothetical protein
MGWVAFVTTVVIKQRREISSNFPGMEKGIKQVRTSSAIDALGQQRQRAGDRAVSGTCLAVRLLGLMGLTLVLCACQTIETLSSQEGTIHAVRMSARPASPPSVADRRDLLLAMHNQVRLRFAAPPLQWDANLADGAARWAARIGDSGVLEHSGVEDMGENLWMGSADRYAIDAMVGAWAEEQRFFQAGRFPDISRSGDWSDVGHFTQMIWPDTRSVGCGFYHGRIWDVLVCRYSPAGNVIGEQLP